MLTKLGKFLRKLRIDRGELLKDMASKLDVTVSFLSSVENGKKKMPSSWNHRICELYNLDDLQKEEFTKSIADSEEKVELYFKDYTDKKRCAAVSFARKFTDFSDRQLEQLMKILEEDE
jgi:transcriptional regulator with XRE-family HTH domain